MICLIGNCHKLVNEDVSGNLKMCTATSKKLLPVLARVPSSRANILFTNKFALS